MEDHRNWSDASFKTYVRPLALPWPYTLQRGIEFKLLGAPDFDRQAAQVQNRRQGQANRMWH